MSTDTSNAFLQKAGKFVYDKLNLTPTESKQVKQASEEFRARQERRSVRGGGAMPDMRASDDSDVARIVDFFDVPQGAVVTLTPNQLNPSQFVATDKDGNTFEIKPTPEEFKAFEEAIDEFLKDNPFPFHESPTGLRSYRELLQATNTDIQDGGANILETTNQYEGEYVSDVLTNTFSVLVCLFLFTLGVVGAFIIGPYVLIAVPVGWAVVGFMAHMLAHRMRNGSDLIMRVARAVKKQWKKLRRACVKDVGRKLRMNPSALYGIPVVTPQGTITVLGSDEGSDGPTDIVMSDRISQTLSEPTVKTWDEYDSDYGDSEDLDDYSDDGQSWKGVDEMYNDEKTAVPYESQDDIDKDMNFTFRHPEQIQNKIEGGGYGGLSVASICMLVTTFMIALIPR
jgi:hypothetical protein